MADYQTSGEAFIKYLQDNPRSNEWTAEELNSIAKELNVNPQDVVRMFSESGSYGDVGTYKTGGAIGPKFTRVVNENFLTPEQQEVVEDIQDDAEASSADSTIADNAKVGDSQISDDYLASQAAQRQSAIDEANRQQGLKAQFDTERDFATQDAYNLAQGGMDLVRLSKALGQIQSGKDAMKTPLPQYNVGEVSPELKLAYQQAQQQAGQGFSDAELGAMQQQNLSAYANALRGVGAAGQGQASLAGSGAQSLYGSALKSNLQTAIANAQARSANQAWMSQAGAALAGDKAALRREGLQYGYMPALQQAQAARQHGMRTAQVGEQNLDQLLSQAPYRVSNLVKDYYGSGVQRGTKSLDDYYTPKMTPEEKKAKRQAYWNNVSNKLSGFKQRVGDAFRKDESVNPNPIEPYTPDLGKQFTYGYTYNG